MSAEQLRAVLDAYRQVMAASWPDLHPDMAARAGAWPSASAESLERELAEYVAAASAPQCRVRLFWKLLPGFTFAGCNEPFARDAGLPRSELIGVDDFDHRLPWVLQAAKYRADDEAVARSGQARLDIIERQRSTAGHITWVRVGKAPIRAGGTVIGILGMYEVLDPATGRRLFGEQTRRTTKPPA